MNERIKELSKQAWDYMQVCDERYSRLSTELFNEKFAELIVRECCSIIEVDLETNKVKALNDNEGKIWVNAQLTFSQLIKSRFDIKE